MTVETMNQTTSTEAKTHNLEAFDAELRKLDAELADMVISGGDASPEPESALVELDQQFSAAGLGTASRTNSLNALGKNEAEAAFIGDFLKGKAEKLIKELRFLAGRYPNCANAIKALTAAVVAFGGRRYPTAIYQAARAAKYFRDCAA